jgi:hypothetical protein
VDSSLSPVLNEAEQQGAEKLEDWVLSWRTFDKNEQVKRQFIYSKGRNSSPNNDEGLAREHFTTNEALWTQWEPMVRGVETAADVTRLPSSPSSHDFSHSRLSGPGTSPLRPVFQSIPESGHDGQQHTETCNEATAT